MSIYDRIRKNITGKQIVYVVGDATNTESPDPNVTIQGEVQGGDTDGNAREAFKTEVKKKWDAYFQAKKAAKGIVIDRAPTAYSLIGLREIGKLHTGQNVSTNYTDLFQDGREQYGE